MMTRKMAPRWARHGRHRYLLLLEAAGVLAAAAVAVRFLPFKQAVRLGAVSLRQPANSPNVGEVCWAVRAAARLVPWRAVCIQQGIALQRMLRHRGVEARLHYGVRRDDAGALQAHVWVEAGKQVLIGGAEAHLFKHVATFP